MSSRPNLDSLTDAVLTAWPGHAKFLSASLAGYDHADLMLVEDLADRVRRLAGDGLDDYIASYKWLCGEMNREALHFKRTGAYRLSSFAQADAEVYSNAPFMRRYMEGLLVSQVFWRNHSAAFLYVRQQFLPRLPDGFRYLEIGPGHGLYLSVAAEDPRRSTAEGWDVSAESLRQTDHALSTLGLSGQVTLDRQDIHAPTRRPDADGLFDGVAICEVLEHLERPVEALVSLRRFLRPGGTLFINVPINSPAPDHIYLLKDEADVRRMVDAAGLEIIDLRLVPMTGYDLDAAQRLKATVNAFVLAR